MSFLWKSLKICKATACAFNDGFCFVTFRGIIGRMVRAFSAAFLLCTILTVYAQTRADIENDVASLEHKIAQLYQDLYQAQAELHIDPTDVQKNVRAQHTQTYISAYEEELSEKKNTLALHTIGQTPMDTPKIISVTTEEAPEKPKVVQNISAQTKPPKKKITPKTPPPASAHLTEKPAQKKAMSSPTLPTQKKPELKKIVPEKKPPVSKKPKKKPGLYTHKIVQGSVLKSYGQTGKFLPDPMHQKSGIVFSCSPDATVYAPTTSEVVLVEKVYGRMACILKHHTNHYTALYGIEYILISENDTVQGGQPIGRLQSEKQALLYAELRQDESAKDISQHIV